LRADRNLLQRRRGWYNTLRNGAAGSPSVGLIGSASPTRGEGASDLNLSGCGCCCSAGVVVCRMRSDGEQRAGRAMATQQAPDQAPSVNIPAPPAGKQPPRRRTYLSIQYLRAIAALMVIFHHARNPVQGLYNPLVKFNAGASGVSIFFVISGFIMYSAAREERVIDFTWRRITRIVPMYWIATLALFVAHEWADLSGVRPWLLKHVLESLFFFPHYSPFFPTQIWPYLVPGWTLNFEMFFYALFAVGLAFRRIVPTLVISLSIFVLFGTIFHFHNAIWYTYTNPILLEFLGGILIARWSDRITSVGWAFMLPVGFIAIGLSDLLHAPSIFTWGIPSVMIVVGAIALEQSEKLPQIAILGLMGNASFSIYLFQGLVFDFPHNIVDLIPLRGAPQLIVMILVSAVIAVAIGIVVHYFLERPIIRYLSRHSPIRKADGVRRGVEG
jgi:exopolysaccharide production protein ExoZ